MKLTIIKHEEPKQQPSQDVPKLPTRRDVFDEFVKLKETTVEGANMTMTAFHSMALQDWMNLVKIEEIRQELGGGE